MTDMQTEPDTASGAIRILSGLGTALAAQYPRIAHSGRIEQIAAHAASLASLIGQLPDEEEREADYEARLLAEYDANPLAFKPHDYPSGAHERLTRALAARNGG